MPDPLLYAQAFGFTAITTALLVLVIGRRAAPNSMLCHAGDVLAIAGGLAVGYGMLRMRPDWPPTNGLHRFLAIVLPTWLLLELLAGVSRIPRKVAWGLRIGLAFATERILLHGSVYLGGPHREWSSAATVLVLSSSGILLSSVWMLLSRLAARSQSSAVPLSLALSIQCAGLAVALAGYLKGGAAAIPLAAALLGAKIAGRGTPAGGAASSNQQALVGLGVLGLFSILSIGLFFGGLSIGAALSILLAPTLGWLAPRGATQTDRRWLSLALHLMLVALPIVIVLCLAMEDFRRRTLPLL
jgi:hypothetical protein